MSLLLVNCGSFVKNENNASKVNSTANEQVFALKGYQPIDPVSINYNGFKNDSTIYCFPNEATRVAIGKISRNGSLSFGNNIIAKKGENYTIIIDYIKYQTTSVPALYSYDLQYHNSNAKSFETLQTQFGNISGTKFFKKDIIETDSIRSESSNKQNIKIPVYVGVGLRIQANIIVIDDSLNINLGSLYNLGIAASQNKLNGTLIIQTLGISGSQISSTLPIPDKINESTIQNAITALATIKSKLYDKDTSIQAHVVGFGLNYNIDGAKDLIEATLHSRPPKIMEKMKNSIVFEEYEYKN